MTGARGRLPPPCAAYVLTWYLYLLSNSGGKVSPRFLTAARVVT